MMEGSCFAPRAVQLGVRSVLAAPIRAGGTTMGAVNIVRSRPGAFTLDVALLLRAAAAIAGFAVVNERELAASQELGEQLQRALESRVLIEQAKGAVSQRLDVPPEEAFTIIRGYARANGFRLRYVCEEVVSGERDILFQLSAHRAGGRG
jgi:GAF domain-containing protein